jgi:prephenate dehydratase
MVRVAFQGEHGAYSEIAAEVMWPGSQSVPRRENDDVVRAVMTADADVGVLAIENSLAGTVAASIDALLAEDDVHVVAEAVVPIHHCLLAVAGTSIDAIRWVESHPIALAQCRGFFECHPAIEARAVYDTAGAAREVALASDPQRAALAGAVAARRYGLAVLQQNLEDRADNQTRFIGISRIASTPVPDSSCKTTVAVTTADAPDALHRILASIATAGLHVARIDTRPTGQPWTYNFVLDVLHRGGDARLGRAVAALRLASRSCRILGTYPTATEAC